MSSARAKSITKRDQSLGEEYQGFLKGKTNEFQDRRIGVKNSKLTQEEKMLKRIQQHRQSKLQRFNLTDTTTEGDTFVLTHMGKPIVEGDRMNAPVSRDEDEDYLDPNDPMFEQLAFGGGADGDSQKTRREIMEEIVNKSKMQRAQRAQEKEAQLDAMDAMDQRFHKMKQALLSQQQSKSTPTPAKQSTPTETPTVIPPQSSPPSTSLSTRPSSSSSSSSSSKKKASPDASDSDDIRTLEDDESSEEAAQDEVAAHADAAVPNKKAAAQKKKHALHDVDPEDEYDSLLIKLAADDTRAYATNRMLTPAESAAAESERLLAMEKERLRRMNPSYHDDDDDDDSGGSQAGRSAKISTQYGADDIFDGFDLDDDSDDDDDDDSDDEDDEDDDDEDGDDDDDDDEDDDQESIESASTASQLVKQLRAAELDRLKKSAADHRATAATSTQEAQELPFTFDIPSTFEEFQAVLATPSKSNDSPLLIQKTILERMLICNHPTLNSGNLPLVERMFEFINDLIIKWGNQQPACEIAAIDNLSASLFAICQVMPVYCAKSILTRINALLKAMESVEQQEVRDLGRTSGGWPRPGHLLWLQSLSNLFPVTDFYHVVISAATLLLCRCLSFGAVQSIRLASCALFSASALYCWCQPTRRFAPEPLHSLTNILKLFFTPDASQSTASLSLITHPLSKDALRQYSANGADCHLSLKWSMLVDADTGASKENDLKRMTVLSGVLRLLHRYILLWDNKNAFDALVAQVRKQLLESKRIIGENKIKLPSSIRDLIDTLIHQMDRRVGELQKQRAPLKWQTHKPIPLKMYRPRFREDGGYSLKNESLDPNRDRAKMKRLQRRVKSDLKSASRELKKDAMYLEQQRISKRQRDEAQKNEKLGKVMHFLQVQQYETHMEDFRIKRAEERKQAKKPRNK